jgi:MFS family permease
MSSRYKLLGLIWLLQFVNYLDRVNISVAAPSMMKSLAIDPGLFGFVLSAFTIGYATMQMPGGILAGDRPKGGGELHRFVKRTSASTFSFDGPPDGPTGVYGPTYWWWAGRAR